MLSTKQFVISAIVGVAFWALVAAQRYWGSPHDPGMLEFAVAVPGGLLSIWIIKWCASLRADQLPTGVLIAGGVAMMIDGIVLRWTPQIYGTVEESLRLFASGLLWGYGVAFVIAVLMSLRPSTLR
jgi:hypothetical protein